MTISDIEILLDFLRINSVDSDLKQLLGPNFKKSIQFDRFKNLFEQPETQSQSILITATDSDNFKSEMSIIKLILILKQKFENVIEMIDCIFGSKFYLSVKDFFRNCELLNISFDMIEKTELMNYLDPAELGIIEKDLLRILFHKYENSENSIQATTIDAEFKHKLQQKFSDYENAFA